MIKYILIALMVIVLIILSLVVVLKKSLNQIRKQYDGEKISKYKRELKIAKEDTLS